MDNEGLIKFSDIKISEWICFNWIEATRYGDKEPMYLRGLPRPLDEAMRLAGGSIKDLQPHLWALKD